MAPACQRRALRLEERAEEEGMSREFEPARFTVGSGDCDPQSTGDQAWDIVGIEAIAAVVGLADLVAAINLV
jgi:hypothetical protein